MCYRFTSNAKCSMLLFKFVIHRMIMESSLTVNKSFMTLKSIKFEPWTSQRRSKFVFTLSLIGASRAILISKVFYLLQNRFSPFRSICNLIFVMFTIIVSIPFPFHPSHRSISFPSTDMFMQQIPFWSYKFVFMLDLNKIKHWNIDSTKYDLDLYKKLFMETLAYIGLISTNFFFFHMAGLLW